MSLPNPHHSELGVTIYRGNCADILGQLEPQWFDACFCGPPYGLELVGKE